MWLYNYGNLILTLILTMGQHVFITPISIYGFIFKLLISEKINLQWKCINLSVNLFCERIRASKWVGQCLHVLVTSSLSFVLYHYFWIPFEEGYGIYSAFLANYIGVNLSWLPYCRSTMIFVEKYLKEIFLSILFCELALRWKSSKRNTKKNQYQGTYELSYEPVEEIYKIPHYEIETVDRMK